VYIIGGNNMKIKLKENAGNEYSKKPYDITLVSLRGQWVDVDTTHVFNDQYNLLNYNIRVFDVQIEAVRDDIRESIVQCGYCGKQFNSMDELNAHYLEEENNAHNCDGCFWYRDRIVDTIHEKEETHSNDGKRFEKRTTTYVWEKQCTHKAGCDRFEHRNHKPRTFTPENTYFLKYPNGYKAFFESLNVADQWKEMGYKCDGNIAIMENIAGTYKAMFEFNENGLSNVTICNTRKSFVLTRDDFESIVLEKPSIRYSLAYKNGEKRKKPLFDGFPKTYENDLVSWLNSIQYLCTYSSDSYKKVVFFGDKK
jgi:hypothetical protein